MARDRPEKETPADPQLAAQQLIEQSKVAEIDPQATTRVGMIISAAAKKKKKKGKRPK